MNKTPLSFVFLEWREKLNFQIWQNFENGIISFQKCYITFSRFLTAGALFNKVSFKKEVTTLFLMQVNNRKSKIMFFIF